MEKERKLQVFRVEMRLSYSNPNKLTELKEKQKIRQMLPKPDDLPMLPQNVEQEEVVAKTWDIPQQENRRKQERHQEEDAEDQPRTAQCSGCIM